MNTLYSLLVLFDVADVVTAHCARAHVTDESEQLVLYRTEERPKEINIKKIIIINV